jgi:hypothetical protein
VNPTRTSPPTRARRSLRRAGRYKYTAFVAVLALFVAAMFVVTLASSLTIGRATDCTVTGKDRTSHGSKSQMRVYTSTCGTFEITDSLLSRRYDSADVYGSLREGATYDFTTRGYRIPLLSMFPNITAVEAHQ